MKNHFHDWSHTGGAEGWLLFGPTGFSLLCGVVFAFLLSSTAVSPSTRILMGTVVLNAGSVRSSLGGLLIPL